jgi:hypothetical protein
MPDPQPTPGAGGYKPRRLLDYQLTPPFLSSRLGWAGQTDTGQVFSLGPTLLDDSVEANFARSCAAIARGFGAKTCLDPNILAAQHLTLLKPETWDTLYGLIRSAGPALWPDVSGSQTNIATGRPATIGKLDPFGIFRPNGSKDVIAGTGLPLIPPSGISLGKRFSFVSDPHVQLYLHLDKDALESRADLLVSGGGVGIEGKTSSGNPLKLRVGAGRDQTGRGAGFITVQIGPDYVAASPQP